MITKESVTVIFDDGTVTNLEIDIEQIPEMVDYGMTVLRIQGGKIVYADVNRDTYKFLGFKTPETE